MKLGRNDPCSCGSTVKYKKCCLPKELKAKEDAKKPVVIRTTDVYERRPKRLNPSVAAMVALAMASLGGDR